MDLVFRNARLAEARPADSLVDIAVAGGRIAAIQSAPTGSPRRRAIIATPSSERLHFRDEAVVLRLPVKLEIEDVIANFVRPVEVAHGCDHFVLHRR